MKSLLVAMGSVLVFAPSASAVNLVYNEAVNGDLSGDSLNPTTLSLSVGSNQIIGSTTGNPNLDRDFFTFDILPGFQLSQVILANYAGLDNVAANQSFLAVQAGSQIESTTVSANTPPLLGAALIGAAPGTQVGNNVLDDLGASNTVPIQGSSFVGFPSGTLRAGTYTFWIQETVGGIQDYNLDFVVTKVPEPSTMIGIGAIASMATFLKRKRKKPLVQS